MNEMLFYFCCLLLLPFFQTRFGWLALLFKLPFPASARTCGCSGCTLKHTNVVPKTSSFCLPAGERKAERTQTPSLTSDSSYAHLLTAFLQPDSHFMCCCYAKQLLRGQRVDDRRAWLCLHTRTEAREDSLLLFILGLMFFITPLY